MDNFLNAQGKDIVEKLCVVIIDNASYLSEIDGLIGDGDHGVNMSKGFRMCMERIEGQSMSMSEAFKVLSRVLMMEIGGSMGPLYGTFFGRISKASHQLESIGRDDFGTMLSDAVAGVMEIGNAQVGDKTLVDVLYPSLASYKQACIEGKGFKEALQVMKEASSSGWLSTKDMVAKIGRASRLGERSRGVLDAGATSCNLILQTTADAMIKKLD